MHDFLFTNSKPFSATKTTTTQKQNIYRQDRVPRSSSSASMYASPRAVTTSIRQQDPAAARSATSPPPAVPPAAPPTRKGRNLTPNASLNYGQWSTKYFDRS